MTDKTSLGDRMKLYERQYSGQILLPIVPIIARVDGRAFHTFCAGLKKPYDQRLSDLMIETTKYLVSETGARVGYTQSDEISLIWYEESLDSEVFFDKKLLKMTSILAAMATAYFNKKLPEYLPEKADKIPLFDGRVFNVSALWEATNYLIWREMDATRNSITQAALSIYSHNELHKMDSSQKQEMLWLKGINWNDYWDGFKKGTYVAKRTTQRPFTVDEIEKLPKHHNARKNPNLVIERQDTVILNIPPLRKIKNREDVIFDGKEPILKDVENRSTENDS